MRSITIGGRTLTVTHVGTETSEYGDIQRYRIVVSGSDAVTHLSSLSSKSAVDADVMASAIDAELLLEYAGSAESGLLRDPGIREWRNRNRQRIEQELARLREEAAGLPAEPMSNLERSLWRAFEMQEKDNNA